MQQSQQQAAVAADATASSGRGSRNSKQRLRQSQQQAAIAAVATAAAVAAGFVIFETAANIWVCTETPTSYTVCMHIQKRLGISDVQECNCIPCLGVCELYIYVFNNLEA